MVAALFDPAAQVKKHEVFTSELFYSTCVQGAEPELKARLRRKHSRFFGRDR